MRFILRLQQMHTVFFFMKSEGACICILLCFLAILFLLALSYRFIALFM